MSSQVSPVHQTLSCPARLARTAFSVSVCSTTGRCMRTELTITQNSTTPTRYLTWAPARATVRLADSGTATSPVDVVLRNQNTSRGGQVVFFTAIPGAPVAELSLSLPVDGTPVEFFVAGQFGRPSK